MQKLGYHALDDVIAASCRIEHLQKDYPSLNMDNLVSVWQEKLQAVRKELKKSATTKADKTVLVTQSVVAPSAPTEAADDNQYVAPSTGMCAPQRRRRCFLCKKDDHFIVPCPIRAEMFCFMQQAGRISAAPARLALPPVSPMEEAADDDGMVSLN